MIPVSEDEMVRYDTAKFILGRRIAELAKAISAQFDNGKGESAIANALRAQQQRLRRLQVQLQPDQSQVIAFVIEYRTRQDLAEALDHVLSAQAEHTEANEPFQAEAHFQTHM